jgi:hypothetical protein
MSRRAAGMILGGMGGSDYEMQSFYIGNLWESSFEGMRLRALEAPSYWRAPSQEVVVASGSKLSTNFILIGSRGLPSLVFSRLVTRSLPS